jgi:hypothetical protein
MATLMIVAAVTDAAQLATLKKEGSAELAHQPPEMSGDAFHLKRGGGAPARGPSAGTSLVLSMRAGVPPKTPKTSSMVALKLSLQQRSAT